jgi:hypothetical protein
MTTGKFIKFPSIEAFSSVNATVKRRFELDNRPKVVYRGKVKLHGTNAGIRVDPDGTVTCFKRTGVCNVENDNAGFANWVETVKKQLFTFGFSYVIYGEWAGPGIQKKVAVSQIEKKTFFVFAILNMHTNKIVVDPDRIKACLGKEILPFEIIPWAKGTDVEVDFRLQSSMEAATKNISSWVEECDKVDPYIKERYGIEGIGEGYVFIPLVDEMSFDVYSDYIFKAKGESHHVSSSEKKVSIQIDPAVLEGAAAFAKEFVTQGRCEQGVTEACGGEAVMKNMGAFMKWIGQDVQKESVNELEASGLDWKNVSKAVNQQARDWYILATERNL